MKERFWLIVKSVKSVSQTCKIYYSTPLLQCSLTTNNKLKRRKDYAGNLSWILNLSSIMHLWFGKKPKEKTILKLLRKSQKREMYWKIWLTYLMDMKENLLSLDSANSETSCCSINSEHSLPGKRTSIPKLTNSMNQCKE